MSNVDYKLEANRYLCETEHLYYTRYFFKQRQSAKFLLNWHHEYIADEIDKVFFGDTENLIVNVAPGSSKTELVILNAISRGLAINPRARFLHLSYSDDLASLNSGTARNIITSDEYQRMWPMKIADDSSSKKRWNVMVDGKDAGGVYATALGGQVTGFRAGHMTEGFSGAILIDDPCKPEDAFSRSKIDLANRKLLTTVSSRKANPKTPIIMIMQRISQNDPTGFIEAGNLPGKWKTVKIPALMSKEYRATLPEKYRSKIDDSVQDKHGRCSYWPYKEPLATLLEMESGGGKDNTGNRVSRHVFASQYQQNPVALGGNVIHGEHFHRYKVLPRILYRNIYVDTAQKTKERHDYSVFECWGPGSDGRIYLLDLIRGKWEAPELQKRAESFWAKHKALNSPDLGHLRKMKVEDKVSGTGLIQTLRYAKQIPIEEIQRNTDKLTRVMDMLPYQEAGLLAIPEDAPFTSDYVSECEAFSADMSHDFDDQIDPTCDAAEDLLSSKNKIKQWEQLGQGG